jgi:hypothetical protein
LTRATIALTLGTLAGAYWGLAWGHDDHDWIRKGEFKDAAGDSCCDPRDCKAVPANDVVELANGDFRYLPTGETIPRAETRPSPDDQYWRCFWHENGVQKTRKLCFWHPVPPS